MDLWYTILWKMKPSLPWFSNRKSVVIRCATWILSYNWDIDFQISECPIHIWINVPKWPNDFSTIARVGMIMLTSEPISKFKAKKRTTNGTCLEKITFSFCIKFQICALRKSHNENYQSIEIKPLWKFLKLNNYITSI